MGTITERQSSYLKDLLAKRVVPEVQKSLITGALNSGAMDSKTASKFIDSLLKAPLAPKPAPAASPTPNQREAAQAKLLEVDTSFFAIPAGHVAAQRIDLRGNDYLFLRVRNWNGKRTLSRVHGSVGGFRYTSIWRAEDILALTAIIEGHSLEFQKNFSQVHGVCGRCAAKLTDQHSRDTGFGPECRKVVGIK